MRAVARSFALFCFLAAFPLLAWLGLCSACWLPLLLAVALCLAGCVLAWALVLPSWALRALSLLFVVRRPCPAWGSASRRASWRACFFAAGGFPSRAAVLWRCGAGSALPRWRCVSPSGLARARSFSGCVVLSVVPAVVRRRSGVVVAFWVLAGGSFPCESKNPNKKQNPNKSPRHRLGEKQKQTIKCDTRIAFQQKMAALLPFRRQILKHALTIPP